MLTPEDVQKAVSAAVEPVVKELQALREGMTSKRKPALRASQEAGTDKRLILAGKHDGEEVTVLRTFTGKRDGELMAAVLYEDGSEGFEKVRFLTDPTSPEVAAE